MQNFGAELCRILVFIMQNLVQNYAEFWCLLCRILVHNYAEFWCLLCRILVQNFDFVVAGFRVWSWQLGFAVLDVACSFELCPFCAAALIFMQVLCVCSFLKLFDLRCSSWPCLCS
ncbi:unnamed protein product [Lathyrus oleraceus]